MSADTPDGYVDAVVYLQVEGRDRGTAYDPKTRRYDDRRIVRAAAVVGHTQSRPGRPKANTITTKITVRVPVEAFDPLEPEAVVVIDTSLTNPNPVIVEAGDARMPTTAEEDS